MKGNTVTKYAIHIAHDSTPCNPIKELDCHPPAVIVPDRHAYLPTEYGLTLSPPDLPPATLQAHAQHMLDALGHASIEECEYLDPGLSEDDALAALYDEYCEHIADQPTADRLQALADLHTLAGQPAQTFSGTDYEALFVATTEWQRLTGVTPAKAPNAIEAAHDDYRAWAEGECYGWGIAPFDPDTRYDGETQSGTPYKYAEHLPDESMPFDQCWGYYGSDPASNGLFDDAQDAIAHQAQLDAKEAEEAAHWAARGVVTA